MWPNSVSSTRPVADCCSTLTPTLLDFLDYYFDLISYVAARRKRLDLFKADVSQRHVRILFPLFRSPVLTFSAR
jgi:hypothetical protein